jgi:hypothetical protein
MSSLINKIKDKVTDTSAPAGHHLTAISRAKGTSFELTHHPTPTLGPNDLLIEVKSIALNPIDHYQRDYGFPPITYYPAVLGSDISGIVISIGSPCPLTRPLNPTRALRPSRHASLSRAARLQRTADTRASPCREHGATTAGYEL